MSTALPPSDQLLYTPKEAATVLRFGRSTVYELMAEGVLRYVKRGRSRRIRRSDLEAYVNNLEPESP
ncbi:helix-turn-helix domain-containing protein [Streptomyces neyagawaensis]|uniref:helix-turn-helix domain-containing protein n=1 Tax=Streptomyces neyagawaensis TaxID=42238 RepID=UPI0006E40256|nr:helix-turn-helix domain-containing protein [Streptomyces neyagawaensis]MCL6736909.1 helix-turn-helix domain-containing protein [Streptomyces neyagawaensis]MDE1687245.1 helix-turn-helix domain-containing protein [Streptomyces neyagawaensis]